MHLDTSKILTKEFGSWMKPGLDTAMTRESALPQPLLGDDGHLLSSCYF